MKKDDKIADIDDIDIFEDFEEEIIEEEPKEKKGASKPSAKTTKPAPKPQPPSAPKPQPQTKTPAPKAPEPSASDEALKMSADVPVQLVAVIGRTTVSVKDLMNYQMGQVVDLGRPPAETVDLVASGKLFARGELVDIDGKLGVRIVKIVK